MADARSVEADPAAEPYPTACASLVAWAASWHTSAVHGMSKVIGMSRQPALIPRIAHPVKLAYSSLTAALLRMFKRLFASKKNPYVPGLDRMTQVTINLSGSEFSITLPPHQGILPEKLRPNVNIYDHSIFEDVSSLKEHRKGALPHISVLQREFRPRTFK